jgi:hypothetical protein
MENDQFETDVIIKTMTFDGDVDILFHFMCFDKFMNNFFAIIILYLFRTSKCY